LDEFGLIRDLALVLVTAAVTAIVFHKLRLPLVLGYLAAGLLVGPHLSPIPIVGDPDNIRLLAQLGVLFLLFSLGLAFHLGKLRRVGGLALTAGTLEVALMVGIGFLVASLFGWGRTDAMFLGAMLAISSTTIIVKVIQELGRMHHPSTQAIFGILLVEDLVAVILIALLSGIAFTGVVSFAAIAGLIVRVAIFVLAALVLGIVVVPRAVDHVAKLRVEEILVLFAVGIAFAVSMVALWLGLSIALGAFIAGAIIAESRASATVERRIAPLRDVFAAVFFVATGILVDPADLIAYWPAILILSVITIIAKVLAVGFATFVAGYPPREAVRVGIGMAMIGEFSFVIASLGAEQGVTSDFLLPIAVAVSATTALITPPLIRHSDTLIPWLGDRLPRAVRDYAHTYHTWVKRARLGGADDTEAFHGRYDMGALLRAVSYGAVLVASAVAARFVDGQLITAWPDHAGLVTAGVFAAWVLVSIPLLVGLARAVRELVDNLVFVVIPPRLTMGGRGQAAAAVLRNTLYAFLAILVTLIGVAAGAAFLPPLPLMLGALGVVAVAAIVLRGSLKRLNVQIEQAVDVVFQAETPAGQKDEVLSLIRERYPWDMHVQGVIVPNGSHAANRRIRDLQLPQKTGASIVSHERDGILTVNPAPDTIIFPGDTVGILGEEEQVEDARHALTMEGPIGERPYGSTSEGVHIVEIEVTSGSPLAGHTLAGSQLREKTGASIVGLRRSGVPMLNPAPVLRLQPGDTVVVLGSPAQVAAARLLFESRSPS
jgi:CPA2 family monovalent cation:H+ antiporter-2